MPMTTQDPPVTPTTITATMDGGQNHDNTEILQSISEIFHATSNHFSSDTVNMNDFQTRFILQCLHSLESVVLPDKEPTIAFQDLLPSVDSRVTRVGEYAENGSANHFPSSLHAGLGSTAPSFTTGTTASQSTTGEVPTFDFVNESPPSVTLSNEHDLSYMGVWMYSDDASEGRS
ncbi:hypothetical protein BJ508DRAFT_376660 [Ascobolus immersus RN42]|uniref:Uncharacterized protein n=1 Tax=Ascobolus immersus RN42 TaxID=1160509 RepID=A0A3N4IAG9_ASCIM|nr:hypothetical protein BJ508DRAFT_376660 [Ascobolus immersus RN42]